MRRCAQELLYTGVQWAVYSSEAPTAQQTPQHPGETPLEDRYCHPPPAGHSPSPGHGILTQGSVSNLQ